MTRLKLRNRAERVRRRREAFGKSAAYWKLRGFSFGGKGAPSATAAKKKSGRDRYWLSISKKFKFAMLKFPF